MGFLTDYRSARLRYKKILFQVNPAYDSILNIQRMYREEHLEDTVKLDIALEILVEDSYKLQKLTVKEKMELLELIFQEYVEIKERPRTGNSKKILDFEEDGDLIYASFLQDYGIDLIKEQGALVWKQFIALFQGLGENTKIKEVMKIRGMEIPKPTQYNQKEIRQLHELKMHYALPVEGDPTGKGLDVLFSTLEKMAERR